MLPLVLADSLFLSTLADVEKQVEQLNITDAQSAQHAATLQVRLTKAAKTLDATRMALKRPFLDINNKIDEVARGPAARIEKSNQAVKIALTNFEIDQRRKAEEIERQRKAELARLEKIRLEEEAAKKKRDEELVRLAAEAAKQQTGPVEVVEFDEGPPPPSEPPPKTETEKKIEELKYAPAPVITRPAGIAFKARLIHKVVDIRQLPEHFVNKTPNDTAIRATFCVGWKEGEPLPTCPGVEFIIDRTTASTGKAGF